MDFLRIAYLPSHVQNERKNDGIAWFSDEIAAPGGPCVAIEAAISKHAVSGRQFAVLVAHAAHHPLHERLLDDPEYPCQSATWVLSGEFVISLIGYENLEELMRVSSEVFACCAGSGSETRHDAESVPSALIGLTTYPSDFSTARDLIFHASEALLEAGKLGRTGFVFYDPEHRATAGRRRSTAQAVSTAIDAGEFTVFYQPKIDITSGNLVGAEALVRWIDAGGIVMPGQFIDDIACEQTLRKMDLFVFQQALQQSAHLQGRMIDIVVSVNMSACHFGRPGFVDEIASLLRATPDVDPRHIAIEILESVEIRDDVLARVIISQIRALGLRIYLDDFGTGHSSLSCLKRLPLDAIKIDMQFVRNLDSGMASAQDRAIVKASIAMANAFGLEVIAEGVETVDALKELRTLGCQTAQGYLFSRPLTAAAFETWLSTLELDDCCTPRVHYVPKC